MTEETIKIPSAVTGINGYNLDLSKIRMIRIEKESDKSALHLSVYFDGIHVPEVITLELNEVNLKKVTDVLQSFKTIADIMAFE